MENTQVLTYADLLSLAKALREAVGGSLMSHEDARFVWRRHLIQAGWKQSVDLKQIETKKVVKA